MLLFFLLFPYPFVLATCYWDACTWYFLNSMVFQYKKRKKKKKGKKKALKKMGADKSECEEREGRSLGGRRGELIVLYEDHQTRLSFMPDSQEEHRWTVSLARFTLEFKLVSNWFTFKPVWPNHIILWFTFTESGFKSILY